MRNLYSSLLKNTIAVSNCQQIRFFPRWSYRRPARVIPNEEYDAENDSHIKKKIDEVPFDIEKVAKTPIPAQQSKISNKVKGTSNGSRHNKSIFKYDISSKINWQPPKPLGAENNDGTGGDRNTLAYKISPNVKPLTISKQTTQKKPVDMLETAIDSDGNFIYTKMKDKDPRVSKILLEVQSKKAKEKNDLVLLEGKRLIKDALDMGCKLEYIIFSRLKEVEYLRPSLPKTGAKLYKMPYNEMQLWSGLVTNPGIMGIFKTPDIESTRVPPDSLNVTIICDNIREASNLGAVLRTSSGFGCKEIILTKGCVNVWDSKVLRSACGAHFKLRIRRKQEWDDIVDGLPSDATIYIADNQIITSTTDTSNVMDAIKSVPIIPYYSVDFTGAGNIVLIIGGETEGISESSYKFAAERKGLRLNIPLSNEVDSLNTGTALGIIAFEMKKQLMLKRILPTDLPECNEKLATCS